MKNVSLSFYEIGLDDEKIHGKNYFSNIAIFSPLYCIGRLEERYKGCPKKTQLLVELFFIFEKYEFFPNLIDIFLDGNYSHRLLKGIMKELGYKTPSSPNCRHFHAWRTHDKN